MKSQRCPATLLLAVLALCVPRGAYSQNGQPRTTGETPDSVKEACVQSFIAAQRLRKKGELFSARIELVSCAQQQCPDVTKPQCAKWLQEVEAALPSILIVANGTDGNTTADVRVYVDGRLVRDKLDGRPVYIDPGKHKLRFEHQNAEAIEQELLISEGQKSVQVPVSFARKAGAPQPPTPPPPEDTVETSTVSPLVYVGFGLGAVGLIVGTVTGAMSLSKASELHDECPQMGPEEWICPEERHSEMDTAYTLAHVSTASFIIAGVGVGLGLVSLFAFGSNSDEADESAHKGILVSPTVGLGTLGLTGQF